MKCNNCGNEIEVNDKFCPFCGAKVTVEKVSVPKPNDSLQKIREDEKKNELMLTGITTLIYIVIFGLYTFKFFTVIFNLSEYYCYFDSDVTLTLFFSTFLIFCIVGALCNSAIYALPGDEKKNFFSKLFKIKNAHIILPIVLCAFCILSFLFNDFYLDSSMFSLLLYVMFNGVYEGILLITFILSIVAMVLTYYINQK